MSKVCSVCGKSSKYLFIHYIPIIPHTVYNLLCFAVVRKWSNIPILSRIASLCCGYDDVIKWKHFPRYWPFVRRIDRYPVNSPHKGQWRVALMFSLIGARINNWVNNREAGDLRRHCIHYDVIVMGIVFPSANEATMENMGVLMI